MATRETKYSHGVIPSSEPIYKYTGKKRAKVNAGARENWGEYELKMWEKQYRLSATNVGLLAGQVTCANHNYNEAKRNMEHDKFMVDTLKKAIADNDFVALMEEEQFGNIPHSEELSFNDLTADMCIGYITSVYGLSKATKIKKILEE